MGPPMLDEATRTALLEAFDDDELLELTGRLIAIESHHQAPGRETPVATYLRDRLRHEGIAAELQEVEPGRCNVLGWLGSPDSGPTLMLNGHIDTVPPGEMPRPFEPLVADGRLHGRGAADMKGAVAAQAYVLICLRRSGVPLNGQVLFAGVVGEEQGTSQGSMHLLEHGPKPDLVVVGEPTALRTAVCHRGFDYYRIDVKGRAAHSSRPEQGVNAVYKAAAVVAAIQERLIPETNRRVHPLLGAAPINVAAIIGSSQNEASLLSTPARAAKPPGAIVPDRCTIHLDRRRLPGETLDSVLAEFEALLAGLRGVDRDLETEVAFVPAASSLETHPPLDTPADHPLALCTAAWSTEVTGLEDRPAGVPFWSDAALFQAFAGIPSIVYGPGHIEVAHSAHESVPVEHLGQAARVYALLAASLGGPAMVASAGAAPPK